MKKGTRKTFGSGMQERSQAEDEVWWAKLERVAVRKPSKEATHPSQPELLSFYLKTSAKMSFPGSKVEVPTFLYLMPRLSVPCTSGHCPVQCTQ